MFGFLDLITGKAKTVSDGSPLPVVSTDLTLTSVEFSRPANTTAYTAGDVVGPATAAVLSFGNLARLAGGPGSVIKARMMTNQSANAARHRLHLYTITPVVIADNAPMTLLFANRASRVGVIDFPALTTEAAGSDSATAQATWERLTYQCAPGQTALLGVLETLDAYTPASGQTYFLELLAERG